MQAVSTREVVTELNPELRSIQVALNPRHDLSVDVLEKIKLKRDEMLLEMQKTIIDTNRFTAIAPASLDALDEKTRLFASKIFRVISEGVNQVNALRGFLNETLPSRLHMPEIKTRLAASPAQAQQIIAEYIGPNNPEKQRFIASQCLEPSLNLMKSLDPEIIDNIVSDSLPSLTASAATRAVR